jgi:hypothetical protein
MREDVAPKLKCTPTQQAETSEKLLSDKSNCGIMSFEVKAHFGFGWRKRR